MVIQNTCKEVQKPKENPEGQYSDFSNQTNKQKACFIKEAEIPKQNQTGILELKDWINERKDALEHTGNRADQKEERISKLKDRNIEMIQVEEERELKFLNREGILCEWSDSIRKAKIKGTWVAHSVKHLTSVWVMISRFVSSSPASSSLLLVRSPLWILCLPLSLCPSPTSKINKHLTKKKKKGLTVK